MMSIMIIERLEAVEQQATANQFAAAARIAARAISQARWAAARKGS
jgi:hypothetical protein